MENAQAEPSMEEILASIRRIIAEDEDDVGGPSAQASETDAGADVGFSPDAEPEDEAPAPEPVAPRPQVAAPSPPPADPVAPRPEPVRTPTPAPREELPMAETARSYASSDADADDDRLLADTAEAAAASAFQNLTANVRVTENGPTLEAIVAAMMKPLLKQWIDENLPLIVEEKVEMEIKRIARRGR